MAKLPPKGEKNNGGDASQSSQPKLGADENGGCKMRDSFLLNIGFEDKICPPAKLAYLEKVLAEVDQVILLSLTNGEDGDSNG